MLLVAADSFGVVVAYQLDHWVTVVGGYGTLSVGRLRATGFDTHWFAHRFIPYS